MEKDYLEERKFQIQISDCKSKLRDIKAGIPQGGPKCNAF